MGQAKLIERIQKSRNLFGTCPCCDEDFRVNSVQMFSANERQFPDDAKAWFRKTQSEQKAQRGELAARRSGIANKSLVAAKSVNLGVKLERILPSFDQFPYFPRDCRRIEPVDYVIFEGLHANGLVQAITFLEVKSGAAKLNDRQRSIRDAINHKKVEADTVERGGSEGLSVPAQGSR